jgi:hypothetical protein
MGKIMTLIIAAVTAIVEIILLIVYFNNKEKKSKIPAKLVKPKRTIVFHVPVQAAPPAWMTQDLATGDRRMGRPDTSGLEVVEIDYDTHSESYDEFVRQMRDTQK